MIDLQLYLPNDEHAILKKFRKISDPLHISYGLYEKCRVTSYISIEKARNFVLSIKGASFATTFFPDVVIAKVPTELFGKVKFPGWVISVESDKHFDEAISVFQRSASENCIGVISSLPRMSETLKKRINLECMCEGLRGRTLLTSIDSVAAEFPAVTVFSGSDKTLFSSVFSRKKYAPFQDSFVNIYLSDSQIRRDLLQVNFAKEGRASPDIFIEDLDSFLLFIQEINRLREKNQLPYMGYLNPTLYQNAYLFSRKSSGSSLFPTTYAIWSANRGLGKVDLKKLEKVLKGLPNVKKSFLEKAGHFTLNLLRSSLL